MLKTTLNYPEQLNQRYKILKKCLTDIEYRKQVLAKCTDDSIFWCNNFAYTFDPRLEFYKVRDIPFVLYPEQEKLVRWTEQLLIKMDDGIVEKSRDTGVSYTILISIILYRWLFHEFNAKIGSRKEELVDRPDDPDSLFWKIDYNLRKLPSWMIPPFKRNYMKLTRDDNNNTITGESANESFARGGRNNLTLFDEHAFWPWSKASWESAGESTTTRLSVSTPPPSGRASFFYKLGQSERLPRFTFHYTGDPRKSEEWVEKQRLKKSGEEFERELNISYEGSLENTVYASQFNLCEQGNFPYDASRPLFVSWDFGLDTTALQWYQWDHDKDHWFLIDSYENSQMEVEYYVPLITGTIKSGYVYDERASQKIKEHEYWKNATHFGDPDVKKRSYQSKGSLSTLEVLESHGITIQSKSWAGKTHYDMKQKTLMFLKKLSIDEKHNEYFSDCIRNARYPERSEISQSTSPIKDPIHDWTSHARSCLEYLADNIPERKESEEKLNFKDLPKVYVPNY
jgi:hypothetical protein